MAIFRKAHLTKVLDDLQAFYRRLRDEVEGKAPPASIAEQYQVDSEHFLNEYTDINLVEIEHAIGHFNVEVRDIVKRIKRFEQKPVHRG